MNYELTTDIASGNINYLGRDSREGGEQVYGRSAVGGDGGGKDGERVVGGAARGGLEPGEDEHVHRKVDFVPGDCERLNHVRWSCTEICAVCHLLDVFLCIVFFYIAVFLYLIWERLSRSDIKLTSFLYKV